MTLLLVSSFAMTDYDHYKIYFSKSLTGHSTTDKIKSLNAGTCSNSSITGTVKSHLATMVSYDKTAKYSYTASIPEGKSNNIKKYQKSSILNKNARQRYTVSRAGVTIKGVFGNN